MATDSRSCPEWKVAPGYEEWNKVNCASCETWRKDKGRCRDINGVKLSIAKRYEETTNFNDFKRMMEDAKDIRIE